MRRVGFVVLCMLLCLAFMFSTGSMASLSPGGMASSSPAVSVDASSQNVGKGVCVVGAAPRGKVQANTTCVTFDEYPGDSALVYLSASVSKNAIDYGEPLSIHAEMEYIGPVTPILGRSVVIIWNSEWETINEWFINEDGNLVDCADPEPYCISVGDGFVFDILWDLRDCSGLLVPAGEYRIQATIDSPVPDWPDEHWLLTTGQGDMMVFVRGSIAVSVDPSSQNVGKGETFTIDIRVDPAGYEVSGGELNFAFDPDAMTADDIVYGDLFGPDPLVGTKKIDNVGGTILYALARAGTTTPPTSPGVFATITFTADDIAGTFDLDITSIGLCDENFEDIPGIVIEDGSLIVLAQANPVRDLPDEAVQRVETFEVAVTFIAPHDGFHAIGLTDFAPSGWTIEADPTWCDPDANEFAVTDNKVELMWYGPGAGYPAGTSFTAVYKVTVPNDASLGEHTFANGTLEYYYGATGHNIENIAGDSTIELPLGTTTITLVVNDGKVDSEPDTVNITVNPKPTATASSNSPVSQEAIIELYGGPAGMASYNWTGPGGWTSSLQNPTRPNATTAMAGTYSLVVTNEHGCTSDPDTYDPTNMPPDVTLENAKGFYLEATGPDGCYEFFVRFEAPVETGFTLHKLPAWTEVPYTIVGPNTIRVELCINGGVLDPAFVLAGVNHPPVANAGPDQTVYVTPPATTAMVTLDGSGSYDPDGDPLTYTWTWDGNTAYGVNPTIELPLGTTTITWWLILVVIVAIGLIIWGVVWGRRRRRRAAQEG